MSLFGQPGQKIAPAADAPPRPPSFDKMDLTIEGVNLQLRAFENQKQVIDGNRNYSTEYKDRLLLEVRQRENDARPRLAEQVLNDADRIMTRLASDLRTKRLFAKGRAVEDAPPGEVQQYQSALQNGLLQNYASVGDLATAYDAGSAAFRRALQMSPAAIDGRWPGQQFANDREKFKAIIRQDFRRQDPEVEAVESELTAFKMVYGSRTRHLLDALVPVHVMSRTSADLRNRWEQIFGASGSEQYTTSLF